METDQAFLPLPSADLSSGLLVADAESLTLDFDNTRLFQNVVVQVQADDQQLFNEFLTINGKQLNGTFEETFSGLPFDDTITVTAKSLSSLQEVLGRRIEDDRLYGVKLSIKWFPEGNPESAQTEAIFVYRYLDIADDNHTDGTVEFADTLFDSNGGTFRERKVLFEKTDPLGNTTKFLTNEARQGINVTVNQNPHFSVESLSTDQNGLPLPIDESEGIAFIFDPTAKVEHFEIPVTLATAGGSFVPSPFSPGLKLRGDSKGVQMIAINKQAFLSALLTLSLPTTSLPGLTSAEKELIGTQSEREAMFTRTITEFDRVLGELAPAIDVTSYDTSLGEIAPSTTETVLFGTFDRATSFHSISEPTVEGDELKNLVGGKSDQDNDRPGLEAFAEAFDTWGPAERAFRLSELLNFNAGGQVSIYLDGILQAPAGRLGLPDTVDWVVRTSEFNANRELSVTAQDAVANEIVATMIHELGHTLGLEHTVGPESGRKVTLSGAEIDFMGPGGHVRLLPGQPDYDSTKDHGHQVTSSAYRIALGLNWNVSEVGRASAYYRQVVQLEIHTESEGRSLDPIASGDPSAPFSPDRPGLLALDYPGYEEGFQLLDLGTVIVDGSGNAKSSFPIGLTNWGGHEVTFWGVRLVGESKGGILLDPSLRPGLVLQPGETKTVILTFDPLVSGNYSLRLEFITDASGPQNFIRLAGIGQSPIGDIGINIPNANLGGVGLNDPPLREESFGTVQNLGQSALNVYDIRLVNGADQFALGGLPGFDQKNPLVLEPGASQSFGILFDAKKFGLQHGTIQVLSDDPETQIYNIPVMGTGLTASDILSRQEMAKIGNDFILLKIFSADSPNEVQAVLRAKSDADGNFEFSITPGQTYSLTIFDPESGLIGSTGLQRSGLLGILGGRITQDDLKVVFGASAAPDVDQNGTPDDIDLVLGTGAQQQSSLGTPNSVTGAFVAPPSSPLIAPDPPVPRELGSDSVLDPQSSDLTPFIQAAHSHWQTLDLSVAQVSALDDPQFVIADLPGSELAITTGTTITLDVDAAGHGWFIDATPEASEEYDPTSDSWTLEAVSGSGAEDKIDLLTVMTHELGHVIGLEDVSPVSSPLILMTGLLPLGIRRLPSELDLLATEPDAPLTGTWYGSSETAQAEPETLAGSSPWAPRPQAQSAPLHLDIFNGTFAISDDDDPGFGWDLFGAGAVESGAAVLREDERLLYQFLAELRDSGRDHHAPLHDLGCQFRREWHCSSGLGSGPICGIDIGVVRRNARLGGWGHGRGSQGVGTQRVWSSVPLDRRRESRLVGCRLQSR